MRPGVKTRVVGACIGCPFVGECMSPTVGRGASGALVARTDLALRLGGDSPSYSGRRRCARGRSTFNPMSSIRPLLRRYAFDAVIVVAAVEIALEVALRDDPREPTTTGWFTAPAMALLVLPLLLRRRFPFAAPAAVWAVAAVLSFVDGRLVVFSITSSVAGMAAAFLLGNLSEDTQARAGLAVVIAGSATVVYNNPDHATGEFLFAPVLFAIGWLAGYALRERAAQAEEAEERAARAERERETASRIAVAEERARIARELHDIVAHSLSVMVL